MSEATSPSSVVIVGAGHAGGRLALLLRDQGYDGDIHLVGDEPHPPYERPALSKSVLQGEAFQTWITTPAVLADRGIQHHIAHVDALDRAAQTVRLSTGQSLTYRHLVLATGGRARPLPLPGADLPGVMTLRTLDDALALRPRLGDGHRLVVIGGGFIGLEAAASARTLGCEVTVIEGAPRLLGRAVPADVAEQIRRTHIDQGIEIRCGVVPTSINTHPGALAVTLADGTAYAADTVLLGIGIVPNTELAQDAGLTCDNGIRVDAQLRTDDPCIHAIGDVARFPMGGRHLRLESWQNAEEQALVVARNILGGDGEVRFTPWFWSDQGPYQLQIAGDPTKGSQSCDRPIGPDARLTAYFDSQQSLVGLVAWGPMSAIAKEFKVARMLLERGAKPSQAEWADPAIKLKSLLSATA